MRENDHDEMARALAEEKKRSYARAEEQKQKKMRHTLTRSEIRHPMPNESQHGFCQKRKKIK